MAQSLPSPTFKSASIATGNLASTTLLAVKADEVIATDGAVGAGSNAFCSASTTFTAGDVGKTIILVGTGTSNVDQTGTITGYTSQHCVSLSFNAVQAAPWQNLLWVQSIGTSQSGAGSYAPGETLTVSGGTAATIAATATVMTTQVVSATINAAGSGGTNGTCTLTGTTGTVAPSKTKFSVSATVSGGAVTAVNSITVVGAYTTNPTSLTAEPVTSSCGGLTGATLTLKMGVLNALVANQGQYGAFPANPVATTSSGSGTGATLNLWTANAGGQFAYGTDNTATINNAVAATSAAGGGTLVFPSGRSLMLGALAVPYTGTVPVQNYIRLTGSGDAATGYEQQGACRTTGCPALGTSGSFLDMRYAGGDGSHIAKIDTRGGGILEIDHLTIMDGGTDNYQMVFTTNTTLRIHDASLSGNPTCYAVSCAQNAVQLGPIVTPSPFYTASATAPFQGYGTYIRNTVFDHIAVATSFGASTNEVLLENNRVTWTCGSSVSRSAPYVFYGVGLGALVNTIRGGYVEMGGYQYAINTIANSGVTVSWNIFDGLSLQDEVMGAPSLGVAYFDTLAISNGILSNTDPVFQTVVLNGPGTFNGVIPLNGEPAIFPNSVSVGGPLTTVGAVGVANGGVAPFKTLTVGDGTGNKMAIVNAGNSGAGSGPGFGLWYGGQQRGGLLGYSNQYGGAYDSRTVVYGYDGLVFDTGNNIRGIIDLSTGNWGIAKGLQVGSTTLLTMSPGEIGFAASFTVAGLPTCNAGANGTLAYVSDATSPTYNGTLTGGGAVRTLALCNGSAWTAH